LGIINNHVHKFYLCDYAHVHMYICRFVYEIPFIVQRNMKQKLVTWCKKIAVRDRLFFSIKCFIKVLTNYIKNYIVYKKWGKIQHQTARLNKVQTLIFSRTEKNGEKILFFKFETHFSTVVNFPTKKLAGQRSSDVSKDLVAALTIP
jgi:hypothetical protein